MKKCYIYLIMSTFIFLTGCGKEEKIEITHSSSQENVVKQYDPSKKVTQLIEDNKLYQAKEELKNQEQNAEPKDKEKIQKWRSDIDYYQTAEKNFEDDRYKVALDNLDKIIKNNDSLAILKDKAEQLKDKINNDKLKEEDDSDKSSKQNKSSHVNNEKEEIWNQEKSNTLSRFMDSWDDKMGQHYVEIKEGSHMRVPWADDIDDMITKGETMQPALESTDVPIKTRWADGRYDNGVYNVVAVYSNFQYEEGQPEIGLGSSGTMYLFTIYNHKPLVLVTQQNQGNPKNYVYFKETENVDLKKGFAHIVNIS